MGLVWLGEADRSSPADAIRLSGYPLLYSEMVKALVSACVFLEGQTVPSAILAASKFVDEGAVPVNAPGRLILLADDNAINRYVIPEQLNLLGYDSEVADDGVIALALWRTGRFALLLTDCQMPNMNGFELTDAIRQSEPVGSHLPILALTANAMVGEAQRCLAHGMDDYLSKPLRMVDLAPMLEKWLPLAVPQV